MGFLDKLWDETLAGPAPESGLGKLRKYNSFPSGGAAQSTAPVDLRVSRSITIVRAPSSFGNTSTTTSPSAPTTPKTPETPGGDFRKFTRRKSPTVESAENRSLTIYDWVIMSSLDRC